MSNVLIEATTRPSKYRKLPIEIEAFRWTGKNLLEAIKFIDVEFSTDDDGNLYLPTLEGEMCCSKGDWVIKGIEGEFYPCKHPIFISTYERADGVQYF